MESLSVWVASTTKGEVEDVTLRVLGLVDKCGKWLDP